MYAMSSRRLVGCTARLELKLSPVRRRGFVELVLHMLDPETRRRWAKKNNMAWDNKGKGAANSI